MNPRDDRPLVALTLGDVAGVGPEVIARAWGDSPLRALTRPFVVGSRAVLERALDCVGYRATVQEIAGPEEAAPSARVIPCLEATEEDVRDVPPGRIDPRIFEIRMDLPLPFLFKPETGIENDDIIGGDNCKRLHFHQ